MKSTILKVSTVLIALIILLGCKKETINQIIESGNGSVSGNNILYSGSTINTTIGGKVIDESNNPISNATVTIGNQTTTTNANGVFFIQNATVDSKRAYVKVLKSGYFLGSRALKPSSTANSFVKIKMLAKNSVGSFNNSAGGTISINGGASLVFGPGNVSLANGSVYNGVVNVYATYLDPTRADLGEVMPGDLAAIDINSNAVVLKTFGMLCVELEGANGESLNVKPGQTVELSMPVVNEQSVGAPASIPLWYFNENSGNWQEEGSANKEGNFYVGHVKHFSIWNCDYPYSMKVVEMSFQCNGQPVVNALIKVTDPTETIIHGYTYTNSNGDLEEMVPQNLALKFIMIDECGTEIYTQDVSAGSTDIDFGIIQISPTNSSVFTATVTDCNGNPVSNALVKVENSALTMFLTTGSNGTVSAVLLTCSALDVSVTAYSGTSAMQSAVSSHAVAATINAGTIALCDQADEYVTFTLDGNTYSIIETGNNEVHFYSYIIDSLTSEVGLYLEAYDLNSNALYIELTNPVLGNNVATSSSAWGETSPGVWWTASANQAPNVNITGGNVYGPYIEGTINGTIIDDNTGSPLPITGVFRAKYD